ncbi:MAG: VanZ family protein [Pseudomonadota bacterium]|jgi:hypothetical protein
MTQTIRSGARWVWACALALVTWLALRPGVGQEWIVGLDKVLHLAAYAVLCGLGALAAVRPVWGLVAGLFCHGLIIEGLQSLVPGRESSLGDLLANAAGLGLGVLVAARCASRLPGPAAARRVPR